MAKIHVKPTQQSLKMYPDTFLVMEGQGYIDTEQEDMSGRYNTVSIRFENHNITEQWLLRELQMFKLTQ